VVCPALEDGLWVQRFDFPIKYTYALFNDSNGDGIVIFQGSLTELDYRCMNRQQRNLAHAILPVASARRWLRHRGILLSPFAGKGRGVRKVYKKKMGREVKGRRKGKGGKAANRERGSVEMKSAGNKRQRTWGRMSGAGD